MTKGIAPKEAAARQRIQLEIAPNPAFIDEAVAIRLTGLPPRSNVTLRAAVEDAAGRTWESRGLFRADADGCVDTAVQNSSEGTYRGTDTMGLFWSMCLTNESSAMPATFRREGTSPDCVTFTAEVNGNEVATAQLVRRWLAPETKIVETCEPSLVAQLFIPPGRGPHRVIIVLGGSGGGFDLDKAAVLSRHGFATLALAYFGVPPLPQWLHRVPLEYFGRAIAWLASQQEMHAERIGVLGVSRGAELALQLGATFREIGPIVAFAPSAVAWGSGGKDKSTGEIIPCWTWRDRAVPFAPLPLRRFIVHSAVPVGLLHRPVKFRKLFGSAMRNREAVDRARIQVEKCCGPILLISGGDDHVWPSARMAKMIVERLHAHNLAKIVEHLDYPGAGHSLRYPYLPTTARIFRPATLKYFVSFGGSAREDAAAQADSWRRAISFFDKHL